MGLQTFYFCENEYITKHTNSDGLSMSTFKKYLDLLSKRVERNMAGIPPKQNAIVFYGWYTSDTYYFSQFATFACEPSTGFRNILLGLSPLPNEINLDAAEHLMFIKMVLYMFYLALTSVVGLIGNNCTMNKSLDTSVVFGFIVCASHLFSIAVQDVLKESDCMIFLS